MRFCDKCGVRLLHIKKNEVEEVAICINRECRCLNILKEDSKEIEIKELSLKEYEKIRKPYI